MTVNGICMKLHVKFNRCLIITLAWHESKFSYTKAIKLKMEPSL